MPELMRSIAAHLREFLGSRRHAPRQRIRLPFSLSWLNHKLSHESTLRTPTLEGFTSDISTTGLGLVVPAIRLGDHYLMGEGRILRIMLDAQSDPIEIHAIAVRYERLEEDKAERSYFIGVQITEMSKKDRERLFKV